ncbi:MAG: flagellar motor protein MotA [Proteobacteria bacterium]|nr:flagellar motor protein MotA [Pseudomonadota bacterium]
MSNPLPYLVRMLLFLAAVAVIAYLLHHDLLRVFLNTPILNSVIVGVLVIGIFFVMRQVISLWPEVRWLRRFQAREPGAPALDAQSIDLLAPMAAMLGERQDNLRLSPTATRALLDGIASRLDERRELSRYMIGLLIFLGLLGTFWGLLETIGAVADAIGGMQVTGGDAVQMFAKLKQGIEGPLKGMATAFGASLFGLSGSLVLGFLELQASQAQGRFHTELEEWLAGATRLSSGVLQPEGEQGVSAYVEALLERTADGLDELTRTLRRSEETREATAAANATLVERLSSLAESMRTQQTLLARLAEHSIELRGTVTRLSERGPGADAEALAAHQRNIETNLARLVEESVRSRVTLTDELRGELRLLARTMAGRSGPPTAGG